MPKRELKLRRERCSHVYQRSLKSGPQRGDRCTKQARIDIDGQYRCFRHKLRYYVFKCRDRAKRRVSSQIKLLTCQLEKLKEIEKCNGLPSNLSNPLAYQLACVWVYRSIWRVISSVSLFIAIPQYLMGKEKVPQPPLSCPLECGQTFQQRWKLRRHIKQGCSKGHGLSQANIDEMLTLIEKTPVKNFCDVCRKQLNGHSHLKAHVLTAGHKEALGNVPILR
jgi:hypothetical protein